VSIAARLLEVVQRAVASLAEGERGLVVAVSGGPDSVALLRLLLALPQPGRLVVAHLNHQLRGVDSDADEAFVAQLCGSLAPPTGRVLTYRSERINVAGEAQRSGENLEAAARRLRYRWLARVAREEGLRWVATGHTAGDQAETVLHRLLRGTGLVGLRGIAATRELESGVHVVRPLLQLGRAQLLEYLEGLGQPYRQDASNLDRDYTRNRIRLELLPLLARDFNPRIEEVLARLAEQAEEVGRTEEQAARELLRDAERPRAGAMLVLDGETLARVPRHRLRELFRLLWQREAWPLDGMSFEGWERLADLVLGDRPAVDLPGFIHARRRGRVIQIVRGE
jgi:tRNA(Ile)-lysidine synthase